MQDLRGADGNVKEMELMEDNLGRRKTIRNIQESHNFVKKNQAVTSLGIAFKRRLEKSEQDDGKDVIQCVAL
jgi:hypothetical protein